MVEIQSTSWLWAISGSINDTVRSFCTVEHVNGRNRTIYATICLSYYTQGEHIEISDDTVIGQNGSAGCLIRRWQIINKDGTITTIEPVPEFNRNAAFISNCASVTFELVGVMVEAYALATIWWT